MLLPVALATLLLSVALLAYATLRAQWACWVGSRRTWIVAISIFSLLNLSYLGSGDTKGAGLQVVVIIAMTATAAVAVSLSGRPALSLMAASTALWLTLVALTWPLWGRAHIDVFGAVTGATGALLHGHNPYTPTFPYLVRATPFLAVPRPGHLEYGPIVPILYALGWMLGDVRVMNVVAVLAIAAGLACVAGQRGRSDLSRRTFLLAVISPLNIFMIQNAWVEIFIVAGIVWWAALGRERPRWSLAPLTVALMVNLLAAPLIFPFCIWSPRSRRQIGLALCIAIAATLPFALASGVGQFVYDIIGFQLSMGPWYNSLTLTSYLWQTTGLTMPGWMLIIAGLAVVVVSIRLGAPTSRNQLALQGALFLALPMLFAKWAFFNYYFLSATMVVLAVADVEGLTATESFRLPRFSLIRRPHPTPSAGRGAPVGSARGQATGHLGAG